MLDSAVYEEVEADRGATGQAAFVVVATSAAAAAGGGAVGGLGGIGLAIGALIGWAVYAWIAYLVGTRLLAGPDTKADWGEVARTLGFANTPRFFLLLAIVPGIGGLVAFVVLIWVVVATVVALRAALDFTTGRAIVTAVLAAFGQAAVGLLLLAALT